MTEGKRQTMGKYGWTHVCQQHGYAILVERLRRCIGELSKDMDNVALQRVIKRAFDLIASLLGLVILAIPSALIALAIKLDDGGPVLYVDKRAGKDRKAFNLYKFRSMVVGADRIGLGRAVAKDDPRITRVGKFLRQFTLDELPQFFNVLKGDMSVVGPRPGTPAQAEMYDDFERRRLEVPPGMTGWAWIHGRNNLPWEERIKLDVWYIDHWSLWLDLRILAKTPLMVLKREGLYGKDGVTPYFKRF